MDETAEVDTSDTFSILSIDPGTFTLGFCLITVQVESLKIMSAHAWTVDSTRLGMYSDEVAEIHSEKFARLLAHQKNFQQVLEFYNPLIVVCETPFFNRLRPSAGGPLYELYATLERTVYDWDHYRPMYGVDPKSVKKNIKAAGNKKPDMLAAIKKIDELQCILPDLLDEHSIDAAAVGYFKLTELRARKKAHDAAEKR